MSSDKWYKVDNVAKVFLATHSARDTRTLRVSCTLTEDIDADILREALERTIVSRSLFQVRIRRGFFWNYIEATDVRPVVTEEHDRPCPVLYGKNYKGILHYKVTYYHRRINLEVFHALTDGAGALEFLNILVLNYLNIKYPDRFLGIDLGNNGSEAEREEDGFERFRSNDGKGTGISVAKVKRAYHIRGMKLPYDQLQFFEGHLSAKQVLERSHALGVSMTSYLGASFMLAIYHDMPALERKKPICISLPVNLRNYYPSETARNFFNSVCIAHTLTPEDTLETVAPVFDAKLKEVLKPENIRAQMDAYEKLEHMPGIRPVPLVIKNAAVRFFTKLEDRHVSAVVSNMGRVSIPEGMKPYIHNFAAFSSCKTLFTVVCSYGDDLVLGTASALRSTAILQRLYREFARDGLDVTLYATEVER